MSNTRKPQRAPVRLRPGSVAGEIGVEDLMARLGITDRAEFDATVAELENLGALDVFDLGKDTMRFVLHTEPPQGGMR